MSRDFLLENQWKLVNAGGMSLNEVRLCHVGLVMPLCWYAASRFLAEK